jgi:hypothetical protein
MAIIWKFEFGQRHRLSLSERRLLIILSGLRLCGRQSVSNPAFYLLATPGRPKTEFCPVSRLTARNQEFQPNQLDECFGEFIEIQTEPPLISQIVDNPCEIY